MLSSIWTCMCVFDAQVGREYRRVVLEAGGSVDGMDMLKTFLGREPCQDAFFQCKGLTQSITEQSSHWLWIVHYRKWTYEFTVTLAHLSLVFFLILLTVLCRMKCYVFVLFVKLPHILSVFCWCHNQIQILINVNICLYATVFSWPPHFSNMH